MYTRMSTRAQRRFWALVVLVCAGVAVLIVVTAMPGAGSVATQSLASEANATAVSAKAVLAYQAPDTPPTQRGRGDDPVHHLPGPGGRPRRRRQRGLADLGAHQPVRHSPGRGRRPRLRPAHRHRPVRPVDQQHRPADQLHQRPRLDPRRGRRRRHDRHPGPLRERQVPPGPDDELHPELAVRGRQQLQRERPESRRRRPARLLGRVPRVRQRRADPGRAPPSPCEGPANKASFYWINSIDLWDAPPPAAQPANSISITSCGAVADNTPTNGTAARAPGTAPPRSRTASTRRPPNTRSVWIPQGTFYLRARQSVVAQNVTVEGAGYWYSEIYRDVPLPNNTPLGSIVPVLLLQLGELPYGLRCPEPRHGRRRRRRRGHDRQPLADQGPVGPARRVQPVGLRQRRDG